MSLKKSAEEESTVNYMGDEVSVIQQAPNEVDAAS